MILRLKTPKTQFIPTITILTSCLAKTGIERGRKNQHNNTFHFLFCKSHHHCSYKTKSPPLIKYHTEWLSISQNIEQLEFWSYPLMRIGRIFSKLHRAKLFSTFDVGSSCWNITVAKDSRKYTAFTTEYGKYEFL